MALEHIERRAARLKQRRQDLRLTQEQVAERMHVAAKERGEEDNTRGQMVSDWERAVNSPSPPKVELLAAALETSVADLSAGPREERGGTPDVVGSLHGGQPQLDRIEAMLADVLALLRGEGDGLVAEVPAPSSAPTGEDEDEADLGLADLGREDESEEPPARAPALTETPRRARR